MTDGEKQIIRAQFAKELIEAELSRESLEKYLKSDMKLSPLEFAKQEGEDADMKEFLDSEFPTDRR
jgi:hypothetical protein